MSLADNFSNQLCLSGMIRFPGSSETWSDSTSPPKHQLDGDNEFRLAPAIERDVLSHTLLRYETFCILHRLLAMSISSMSSGLPSFYRRAIADGFFKLSEQMFPMKCGNTEREDLGTSILKFRGMVRGKSI